MTPFVQILKETQLLQTWLCIPNHVVSGFEEVHDNFVQSFSRSLNPASAVNHTVVEARPNTQTYGRICATPQAAPLELFFFYGCGA